MLQVGAHELAGVEGVSFRALRDELHQLGLVGVEEVADQVRDGFVGERLERDRQVIEAPTAPVGTAVEQLRTGKRDHQHRRLAPWLHHELHQVEEAVTRPVQVLEDDDQRPAPSRRLHRGAPGHEQKVPVHAFRAGLADGDCEQARHALGVLEARVAQPRGDGVADLGRRSVFVEAGQGQDHLPHRPVGQLLSVRKALRGGDQGVGRKVRQPAEELLDQARLACAGGCDDADDRRPLLVDGAARHELDLRQVGLAADQRQADSRSGLRLARAEDGVRRDRR